MENPELNKLLENTLYINLDFRHDKNVHALKELKKLGIDNPKRISAVDMTSGKNNVDVAIGCTLSHIKCLEYAKENQWDYVFICEDDVYFTDVDLLKNSLNNLLKDSKTPDWDILLLSANLNKSNPPNIKLNENCILVKNSYCAAAYIIKKRYYDTMIQTAMEGIKTKTQIDVSWLKLQLKDTFIMVIPASVTQYSFYSDIEKTNVDYFNHLLNVNKGL
jgi:GR25 family glycosyltransferase involved in LPS biosynthesis